MPNSNLIGHMDRRIKTQAESIRVKDALDEVYKAYAGTGSEIRSARNGETLFESACFRQALNDLDFIDRETVRGCVSILCSRLTGVNFGEGSAIQVIAKLGIFLSQAEKRNA